MIVDTIDQIWTYNNISTDLLVGLNYLKAIDGSIPIGMSNLSDKVTVIVSEYKTKLNTGLVFEAHKKAIDIQYPIVGKEMVQWAPMARMEICSEYDENNDRTYYKNTRDTVNCIIGKGVFAVFFPEDAHNPQNAVTNVEMIKKITVKVLV
jgi:YhcH/YjgK/YiaL family protein